MADKPEIARNSLDILSQAFETSQNALDILIHASAVAFKFDAVSKILGIAGKLSSAFPLVGAVLGLAECFLPDEKHEAILRRFGELSKQIDQMRELEKMIKWNITNLQYGDVVSRIELGMEFCFDIGRASGKAEKMRYQERLKVICANQNVNLAVNALLDGITGNGDLQMSILDEFYKQTKGDRPKVESLAARLLQLLCCGMMVIATYETVTRGKEGAEKIAKVYDSRFQEACKKVKYVITKCKAEFQENMLNDLNRFLDKGGSSKELLSEISDFMRDKYDWLENFCLVYNDLDGLDKHCFGGLRVDSLHRNGKCGIVFYRKKDEPPRFSDKYKEAYEINRYVVCVNAQTGYNNIVAKLDQKNIGWIGCAVVRNDRDLCYGGTFSTVNATIVGRIATAIILLG